jgi:ribonuclease HII
LRVGLADFKIERELIQEGYSVIAGLDEAGRGALFGPVVAAAVAFPIPLITGERQPWLDEINDSKLLSANKRKRLAKSILENTNFVGIGLATNTEIDRLNIYWASLEAMRRAIDKMGIEPEYLLVDGFCLPDVPHPQKKILKGDRKSKSIAAASILAKVIRDEILVHLDKVFSGYALSKHKGYGTKEHYAALRKIGPTDFHRRTFNLGFEEDK